MQLRRWRPSCTHEAFRAGAGRQHDIDNCAMSQPSTVPVDQLATHMVAVHTRMAGPLDAVMLRANAIESKVPRNQLARLLEQAIKSRNTAQKIHWLRREADLILDASSTVSACRSGCAHCCNIGVQVSEAEARAIGKEIGRLLASPSPGRAFVGAEIIDDTTTNLHVDELRAQVVADYSGVPCTFLKDDDTCAIYHYRPIACRHLVNLDIDNLLCQLVPNESISVPYLGRGSAQVAYLVAMGVQVRIADLREWFPKS